MKRVLYVHDFKFLHGDQSSYSAVGMPEKYFDRFFDAGFNLVSIVSRGGNYQNDDGYFEYRSNNIDFPVKFNSRYINILSPVILYRLVRKINESDIVVINLPSIVGTLVVTLCFFMKKVYVVELAADLNAFATKRFGKIVSLFQRMTLPFFIKKANGVAYVADYLKKKYPTKGRVLVASNVNLTFLKTTSRSFPRENRRLKIGFAGALSRRKGVSVIIEAASILKYKNGLDFEIHLLGGHAEEDWEVKIKELNLSSNFVMHGMVSQDEVLEVMDSLDLYLQPSSSEGVPRATIEAMACALPVVATRLPGFLALLDESVLVPVGSASRLAEKICDLLSSSEVYENCSSRNLGRASMFSYEKLAPKRANFFKSICLEGNP